MGAQYELVDGLLINLGYAKPSYASFDSIEGITLSQSRNVIGLGIAYKALWLAATGPSLSS